MGSMPPPASKTEYSSSSVFPTVVADWSNRYPRAEVSKCTSSDGKLQDSGVYTIELLLWGVLCDLVGQDHVELQI
jgi:hypothetical protein